MGYIDSVAGNRDGDGLRWGVESICVQLTELGAKIAPATYYEHRGCGPTAGFDDLEIATAEWVDWFNHRRPFEYCDDLTPVEAETAHYAHHQSPATAGVSS